MVATDSSVPRHSDKSNKISYMNTKGTTSTIMNMAGLIKAL